MTLAGEQTYGVVCVDFDATIVQWGALMEEQQLTSGVVEFMQRLKSEGWEIVILTSRLSLAYARGVVGTGDKDDGRKIVNFIVGQEAFVARTLRRHNIPFDKITADKVPADRYIDDKAITFRGNWDQVYEAMPKR